MLYAKATISSDAKANINVKKIVESLFNKKAIFQLQFIVYCLVVLSRNVCFFATSASLHMLFDIVDRRDVGRLPSIC